MKKFICSVTETVNVLSAVVFFLNLFPFCLVYDCLSRNVAAISGGVFIVTLLMVLLMWWHDWELPKELR